ncbi:hypothetical protein [Zavarzinella formosa]|uniref:hypothetical protein n=1 Tax=Zavarzinella formosa TaxID=360055 RepID=UPI0003162D4C|nr:hypothetical protein [Zavarzinella formosa]
MATPGRELSGVIPDRLAQNLVSEVVVQAMTCYVERDNIVAASTSRQAVSRTA